MIGQECRMCFGCGRDNPIGLHMEFQREGDVFYSLLVPRTEFQGYPGIMHGGIVSTLLDEVMTNDVYDEGRTVVTAELAVRYKRPVPIDRQLKICSRRKDRRDRLFLLEGWIEDEAGYVLATAQAKIMEVRL